MSKKTTGRLDSIKTAFKSLFEAVVRPKKGNTIAERAYWEEKVPEIDWGAKSVFPTPGYSFDASNTPLALKDNYEAESYYTKTYTSFCGVDAVTQINGDIRGEIHDVHYKVNGDMAGEMEVVSVQFEKSTILPQNGLGVTVFANEYGKTAYQVFKLGGLKEYETGYDVDNVQSRERCVYDFVLLTPHQPIPAAVVEMPDDVFVDMVKKVYEHCQEKSYLPEKNIEDLKPHLSNRMYFYYLYKHFC